MYQRTITHSLIKAPYANLLRRAMICFMKKDERLLTSKKQQFVHPLDEQLQLIKKCDNKMVYKFILIKSILIIGIY